MVVEEHEVHGPFSFVAEKEVTREKLAGRVGLRCADLSLFFFSPSPPLFLFDSHGWSRVNARDGSKTPSCPTVFFWSIALGRGNGARLSLPSKWEVGTRPEPACEFFSFPTHKAPPSEKKVPPFFFIPLTKDMDEENKEDNNSRPSFPGKTCMAV